MVNKFLKNGKLQDEKISEPLRTAVNDFDNGELTEVANTLNEIVHAINDFKKDILLKI